MVIVPIVTPPSTTIPLASMETVGPTCGRPTDILIDCASLASTSKPAVESDEVSGMGGGPVVIRTPWLPRTFTRPFVPRPGAKRVITLASGVVGGNCGRLTISTWLAETPYVPRKDFAWSPSNWSSAGIDGPTEHPPKPQLTISPSMVF